MSAQRSRTPAAAHPLAVAVALLIALLAAACSNPAAPDPAAQATISALATSNAQLSTQVAELVAAGPAVPAQVLAKDTPAAVTAAPAAAPAALPNSAAAATLGAAPAVAQPGSGPLPQLLAEVPLAPGGETLYDLRIDRATNHLFVTDSADQLHVLDATTYAPLAVLPYGGWLELDSAHQRIYVYKPYITQDEESLIHVIDTGTLEEIGSIPGRALSIDSERNRLFVGEPYVVSLEQDAPGVRIVDGATLQQTGIFTQSGAPLYNPLRDELLIAAYTVYAADPETQQVTGDLFPELTDVGDTGFLWCNSCPWVDEIQSFPAEQLVMVAISRHCTGGGCGRADPPRFFDAATMQPLDAALAPEVQADCGSQASLSGAVDGRRYHNEMYSRYVVFNNLLVTDTQAGAEAAPVTQRDGLRIDYVNDRTGQGYLYDGMVLDLATLAPIGRWPAACLMAEEADAGLLYGYRSGSLYVIAERGAEPAAPAAPQAAPLPVQWPLRQIAVSPNYAADNTLLAVSDGGIYRSTDGAQTWVRLAGGLPSSQESRWIVAFSPTYAEDRTIFAAGDRNEYWGEGVWRSTDGGDTWQAGWGNLEHRRIANLYLVPSFAADQTLVAQANYNAVATSDAGVSLQQSTDGGLTWTLVATSTTSGPSTLPPISELLPGYAPPPALPVRVGDLLDSVQVTLDGTEWITVPMDAPEGEWFYAVLPAPTYPDDPTLYVFGHLGLWRSTDGGAAWSAWEDGRLNGLDYTNQMSTASITPVLVDGGYRLVVGTANGQVWVLDPAQMAWGEAVDAAPPASVAAAALPSPTPGAAAPPAAGTPAQVTSGATNPVTSTGGITETSGVTITKGVTATTVPTGTTGAPAGTPTPAVTAEPLAGDPPAGLFRPEGSLGVTWNANARIQQDLGWARQATPNVVAGAYQRFEHGVMVWRSDTSQIFAFLDDGSWYSFADTFEEGDQESDLRYVPPAGKQQPIRGFGKVWRENPDLRQQIGWALAKEEAQPAEVQLFERGQMLRYGPFLFSVLGVDTDSGRWY